MQLSDRIQTAVDGALFSLHKAKRDHDSAPSEELALIYTKLDDAYRQLQVLKDLALKLENAEAA